MRRARSLPAVFLGGTLLGSLLGSCGRETPKEGPTPGGDPAVPQAPPVQRPPLAPVRRPPPPAGREDAVGTYLFHGDPLRVRLDLAPDGTFAMRSWRSSDAAERSARGTWDLDGSELVLVYLELGGAEVPSAAQGVTNRWTGETVRLVVPGQREPLVLRRQQRIIIR